MCTNTLNASNAAPRLQSLQREVLFPNEEPTMKLSRLIAAMMAALALSACVGGAIVPVPVDSGPRASYYGERYYYPDGTYTERYRY